MIVSLRVIVHQPKLTAWRSKNIIILPALAKVDFYLRLGLQAVPLIAAPTCGRKLIKNTVYASSIRLRLWQHRVGSTVA